MCTTVERGDQRPLHKRPDASHPAVRQSAEPCAGRDNQASCSHDVLARRQSLVNASGRTLPRWLESGQTLSSERSKLDPAMTLFMPGTAGVGDVVRADWSPGAPGCGGMRPPSEGVLFQLVSYHRPVPTRGSSLANGLASFYDEEWQLAFIQTGLTASWHL